MTLLFATRLLVYLAAVAIPIVHPAVTVSYDRVGWVTWFALVPLEMALAAFLQPPRLRFLHWAAAAVGLAALAALAGPGLNVTGLSVIGVGLAAFALTAVVFHGREHGHLVAGAELLFVGYVLLKLLRFSRASDVIADESSRITTVLVVMITCGVLLHALALYLAAFPESGGRVRRRELAVFALFALPAGAALGLLLPADFVANRIAFNGLNEVARPDPQPIDAESAGPPGGNLRPAGQRPPDDAQNRGQGGSGQQGSAGEQGDAGGAGSAGGAGQNEQPERQQRLEGIPADRWNESGGAGGARGQQGGAEGREEGEEGGSESQEGGGDSKQRAVMVIASAADAVYAADGYYADLQPQHGFSYSAGEPLNDLVNQRLLTTWVDVLRLPDRQREEREYFVLSSISERVTAYRPYTVEPTVLDRLYHPFDFSYRAVSRVSAAGPDQWRRLGGLSAAERTALAPYLAVPLSGDTLDRFRRYAAEAAAGAGGYYDRIAAIMESFETYQYELGFTDDVSVGHLEDFLFETRSGDCTEFSNTTALLGRLLGIPSRVVTGWLAAESLQTPVHRRGLQTLQEVIEPLREFALDDLFLVTDAHRHSWTQFYLPGYGWVDFDPTDYSIPPEEDANTLDVVIPIIEIEEVVERDFRFPWLLALRLAAALAIAGAAGAYAWRYGREALLALAARSPSRHGVRARASLLYMRLAADGYAIKPQDETAREYAERYPALRGFAERYTALRYRPDPPDQAVAGELRASARAALQRMRRRGAGAWLQRLVSLRGLSC